MLYVSIIGNFFEFMVFYETLYAIESPITVCFIVLVKH